MSHNFQAEFAVIGSEEGLAAFIAKYNLRQIGTKAIYVGAVDGQTVRIDHRWWDPSSVYAAQRDEHEAVLLINGNEAHRVRFTGNS